MFILTTLGLHLNTDHIVTIYQTAPRHVEITAVNGRTYGWQGTEQELLDLINGVTNA